MIAATWAVVAATLAGIGSIARRLVSLPSEAAVLARSDIWAGLGATVAYLQLYSLFAPIDTVSVLPLLAVGSAGMVAAVAGCERITLSSFRRLPLVAAAVVVVWIANLSLGRPTSYDSGLYHFAAVEYATDFAAIPGVANLHDRLGQAGPHFLFIAALGFPPWEDAGFHIANGLLVALLVLELAARVAKGDTRPPGFRSLFPAVLAPIVMAMIAIDPGGRVSSPSIDLPVFVLFVVGSLYLADAVAVVPSAGVLLALSGAFAVATAIRPLLAPAMVCALAITVLRFGTSDRGRRSTTVLLALPVVVAAGSVARQTVLTGYPLFPLGIGLPFNWRMTDAARENYVDTVAAWAREPGGVTEQVLGSWAWVGGWAARTIGDIDVAPALALVVLGLLLVSFPATRHPRRARRREFVSVAAPSVVGLATWFLVAPDPRFAYGPIWVLAAALVAWVLPAERAWEAVVVVAASLLSAVAVAAGTLVPYVVADGEGPLGSVEPPVPRTHPAMGTAAFVTPLRGDRCWRVTWCAPSVNPSIELRGKRLTQGFSTR